MQNEYKQALQQIKQKGSTESKTKRKNDSEKTGGDPRRASKKVTPKKGEPHKKEFDGKTYIYSLSPSR